MVRTSFTKPGIIIEDKPGHRNPVLAVREGASETKILWGERGFKRPGLVRAVLMGQCRGVTRGARVRQRRQRETPAGPVVGGEPTALRFFYLPRGREDKRGTSAGPPFDFCAIRAARQGGAEHPQAAGSVADAERHARGPRPDAGPEVNDQLGLLAGGKLHVSVNVLGVSGKSYREGSSVKSGANSLTAQGDLGREPELHRRAGVLHPQLHFSLRLRHFEVQDRPSDLQAPEFNTRPARREVWSQTELRRGRVGVEAQQPPDQRSGHHPGRPD